MSDLISREALLKKAKIRFHEDLCGVKAGGYTLLYADVENAHAIDAVPVVHGEWIDINDWRQKCSVCGYGREQFNSNFCANCGAKMDGGITSV